MPLYMVSYDLLSPTQDYSRLLTELRRVGAVPVLESQWVMKLNGPAAALRDHFRRFVDGNDRLLVVQLDGTEWASVNAKNKISAI